MRNLRLREMLLVSHREKRAKKIAFHPAVTLIRGPNDTGKSCLIKSIYHAFGATPRNIHTRWKDANVSTLVRFAIDEKNYAILRQGQSYSLFSGTRKLLGTYSSITNELGPRLATLFDFQLQLVDRDNEPKTPPPAYLFLPFYIDQDFGWATTWASFENLGQFHNWRRDVIYYHTGMRPNKWYELKSASRIRERAKNEPVHRERALQDVLERLTKKFSVAQFDIDFESYKREIDRLLKRCEKLRKQEEKYKKEIVELEIERMRLKSQQEIVTHSRTELIADYEFATKMEDDHVECPTCGALYENSFAERFAIACDEDRCLDLLDSIREGLAKADKLLAERRQNMSHTSTELEELNAVLATRQGKVTLRHLIENEGRKEVTETLRLSLKEVQEEIAKIDSELRKIGEELSKFENKKWSQKINNEYGNYMRKYLYLLNVTTLDEKCLKSVDATIRESGSDLPRAILAYVFSVLEVVKSFGSSSFCPIVIDAPHQQEQDKVNHRRILNLIKDYRPQDSQLILGLVDDCNLDFGGEVVEMKEKNFALSKAAYKDAADEIAPYSEAGLGL